MPFATDEELKIAHDIFLEQYKLFYTNMLQQRLFIIFMVVK